MALAAALRFLARNEPQISRRYDCRGNQKQDGFMASTRLLNRNGTHILYMYEVEQRKERMETSRLHTDHLTTVSGEEGHCVCCRQTLEYNSRLLLRENHELKAHENEVQGVH
jgi:hypothetical protein